MTPIRYRDRDCLSLRQVDQLNGLPKGSAFRCFKRLREHLVEGEDFFLLEAAVAADFIERLRRDGLIYASTVNVVLLTERGYQRLRQGREPEGAG